MPKATAVFDADASRLSGALARIHDALAKLSVKNGDDFRLADKQATHLDLAIREGDDVRAVRLGEVKFGDIAGVEVDHCPSRISEMICVLSVPPESLD